MPFEMRYCLSLGKKSRVFDASPVAQDHVGNLYDRKSPAAVNSSAVAEQYEMSIYRALLQHIADGPHLV